MTKVIRGVRNFSQSRGFPPPRPQPVSLVPGHDAPLPPPFSDYGTPPDIRQYADMHESLARGTVPFRNEDFHRIETMPGGIRMSNFSAPIVAANVLQRVLAQNYHRKRFLISVLDTFPATVYFCFFQQPNALTAIGPGGAWDESGSGVSTDEIWIMSPGGVGKFVTVYEGVVDDMPRARSR
jgi:hypothetical protein